MLGTYSVDDIRLERKELSSSKDTYFLGRVPSETYDAKHVNGMSMKLPYSVNRSSLKGFVVAAVLCVATFARLLMSLTIHMWYAYKQSFDDELLMSYSWREHFLSDGPLSLAKSPGYPYFLRVASLLGLNADVMQFVVWLIAAVGVGLSLYKVFRLPWLGVASYLYVLWNPIAFENCLGTRLYRNSLFPPLIFLMLGLMLLWLDWGTPVYGKTERKERFRCLPAGGFVLLSLVLGATICLVLLLKEDAEWCLPLVAAIMVFKLVVMAWKYRRWASRLTALALVLTMLIPVGAGIGLCKAINARYFGVSLLNTRTEGEVAEFVKSVYSVDSEDQNYDIWAPESSIDAVFSVSPTLSKNPKLLWSVKHVMFTAPDIRQNPLHGDFLTWQIRFAYDNTYGWSSEPDVQDFFRQANKEIDQAFKSGELHRTSKIRLSGLLVPRDGGSVVALIPKAAVLWHDSLVFASYADTFHENSLDQVPENIRGLERMHVDVTNPNPSVLGLDATRAKRVAAVLVKIYRLLNYILLAMAVLSFILVAVLCVRRRYRIGLLTAIGCIGLGTYAWVYCFSVKWFSEFLNNGYWDFFYSGCVAIPFIAFSLLLGTGLFFRSCRDLAYIQRQG